MMHGHIELKVDTFLCKECMLLLMQRIKDICFYTG